MPGRRITRKLSYTDETIKAAITAVKAGMTLRKASLHYNIPKSTLADRLSGKRSALPVRGPKPVLTKDEEKCLKCWIKDMSKCGFKLTGEAIRQCVKQYLDQCEWKVDMFMDNLPGKSWLYGFMSRHQDLNIGSVNKLKGNKKPMTAKENHTRDWLKRFQEMLLEEDITQSEQIYYCDEISFPLHSKTGKLATDVLMKDDYRLTSPGYSQITVLMAVCADGRTLLPFVVYPAKTFSVSITIDLPAGTKAIHSDCGGMTQNTFYSWLKDCFIPSLPTLENRGNVVLLLDDHKSHKDICCSTLCKVNNVILFCLPSRCNQILQPLTNIYAEPLKAKWLQACEEWIRTNGVSVDKITFARVFKKAHINALNELSVVSNFALAGIWPLNQHIDHEATDISPTSITDLDVSSISLSDTHHRLTSQPVASSLVLNVSNISNETELEEASSFNPFELKNASTSKESMSPSPQPLSSSVITSILQSSGTSSLNGQSNSEVITPRHSPTKSKVLLALEAIETTLSPDEQILYRRNFEFSLPCDDVVYHCWKLLKLHLKKEESNQLKLEYNQAKKDSLVTQKKLYNLLKTKQKAIKSRKNDLPKGKQKPRTKRDTKTAMKIRTTRDTKTAMKIRTTKKKNAILKVTR
ncbi:uncharacterized protein LOC115217325 isoform X1 [Octopus sinensis]|uniref:Uncharacterized protein LOC115217325 isoform X1 n=1 Tax=Octopus sinensis TaxID=2607531 RepID=A0A6P7SX11_9MOLL|nr:uncharacterized protein LOC115217325 isoform X1 [Octopus sinensis]XP_036363088.1 uncharacterized protein LOC115217325 isoform X1 [Octopus sinensis]XP_036363089.1 uncharacterized protein LOC115217325 isoform X1 [Octopus sinensis]XP_036363090.1 uncharacterized protein LOC115217325 isoform X1 [Octopus sinensis]